MPPGSTLSVSNSLSEKSVTQTWLSDTGFSMWTVLGHKSLMTSEILTGMVKYIHHGPLKYKMQVTK